MKESASLITCGNILIALLMGGLWGGVGGSRVLRSFPPTTFNSSQQVIPIYEKEQDTHHQRNIGLPQIIDLDDLPVSGLSPQQARDLLFERYRARMMELHDHHRVLQEQDLTEKEITEICGSSASLECGKEVLQYSDYSEESLPSLNIHRRCSLRQEFLNCIDVQRMRCRLEAKEGIFPRMPPKSLVRSAQSKIWRALWTSGGCTLVN